MLRKIDSNLESSRMQFVQLFGWKMALILSLLALYLLLYGLWFKVEQTERGNVRRFGVVQYASPVQPGLHFKLPLIDVVDKVQVSLTTVHIPPFDVTTIDNQKVTLDINFNYTIPDDKIYHVMYEIGRPGSTDVDSQVVPVVKDRTGRIFAGLNMASVNAERQTIQKGIENDVAQAISNLFGIQLHSIQIAGIIPSSAFMASNEQAVKAKNAAVAAENTKKTRQFEADQLVIKAKGDADSAIEAARGRSESMLLEAQANKTRQMLEGEGLASRLAAEIKPFGTPDKYIEYLRAKAALNWDGRQPQIVAGSGSSTNLIVPVPQPAASGQDISAAR